MLRRTWMKPIVGQPISATALFAADGGDIGILEATRGGLGLGNVIKGVDAYPKVARRAEGRGTG
jgi:hypothetical protein